MNRKLILTIASAALATAFAQADPVTVHMIGHTGTNSHSLLNVSKNGGVNFNIVTATPFNVKVEWMTFIAYCTEVGQGAAANGTDYTADRESVRTFLASPLGDRLAYLYNHNQSNDLDSQIALQLAIWETLYDTAGSYSLTGGNFRVSNLAGGNAFLVGATNSILNDMLANANMSNYGEAMHYQSDAKQDLLGPTPEPASLAALGIGAVAILRRRKNRK